MENIFNIEMQEGQSCVLKTITENNGVTEYEFCFSWNEKNAEKDDAFTVSWLEPYTRAMYKWEPCNGVNPYMFIHAGFPSMISKDAPVCCFFDGKDQNAYCWAVSECKNLIWISNWTEALKGNITSGFTLRTAQYTNQYTTSILLRIDRREVPMYQAIKETADWWIDTCKIIPVYVPSEAKDPLYSFWYSHAQEISETIVEEECRRAKEIGIDVCIVDDGWQTDHFGGYGYCGDWTPSAEKFPDMAAHVKRVHEIGMKYILWYSVPFLGHYSKNYPHFQNMVLRDKQEVQAAVLDPRYKEVREFLLNIYKKALLEWDLDGFKLDFIDEWCEDPANAPYNEKMDIPALQDAVEVCMSDIIRQLTKIKPDLMVEFRQKYIGPHMKGFGNMFRVSDCPGDYLYNRTSILGLRMLMGEQAVHSDMLMLKTEESAEKNAIQIISCMFGVLQYAGRLDLLPQRTREMSRFWIHFLKEHKELLLSENLKTYEPHLNYTWAQVKKDNECAVGVYAVDKCIQPDDADTIYIANGCSGERILLEIKGEYRVQILDCTGKETSALTKEFSGISELPVPAGGLVILYKES